MHCGNRRGFCETRAARNESILQSERASKLCWIRAMSTCRVLVSGYIRRIILSKKATNIHADIVGIIAVFAQQNDNHLVMLMIMDSKSISYHNISILNSSTLQSYPINITNYNHDSAYCTFRMQTANIPKWLMNDKRMSRICEDEAFGIIQIGFVQHPSPGLFLLNGANCINPNIHNSMHFTKLPPLNEILSTDASSVTSIFHNDRLFAFEGLGQMQVLDFTVANYSDLQWKTIDFEWNDPRTELSICSIPSENKLVLLGGSDMNDVHKPSAEVLDLESNKLKKIAAMNHTRLNCGCLFDEVMKDQIFVCGGLGNGPEDSSKTMEIYNFDKDEWKVNEKLMNYEHVKPVLFRDKNNPNILMIAGNRRDIYAYGSIIDGFIEWTDLRDPFPRCKWSLLSEKGLHQFFNVSESTTRSKRCKWLKKYLTSV